MKQNLNFKRTLTISIALFAVAGAIIFVTAAKTNGSSAAGQQNGLDRYAVQHCTNGTITGAYGMNFTGISLVPSAPGSTQPPISLPLASVNRFAFDGAGNVSGEGTGSFNGEIGRGSGTGTYTVRDNCTGTMSNPQPNGFTITQDFIIVSGGKEIFLVQTNPSIVGTGTMKKL